MFIIGVLIALSVLVTVHEMGHFLAARAFGVTVDKFSIGFGPKLIGFTKGTTNFFISLIPLGGYVKMKGDEPQEDSQFAKDDFYGQSWWRRALIVVAGPMANLLLGLVLFSTSFIVGRTIEDQYPIVGQVTEELQIYFQPEDRLISVNGNEVTSWGHLIRYTNEDDKDEFVLERDGSVLTIETYDIEPMHWVREILPLVSATIGTVAPGMPAYRSGLKEDDIILAVDGKDVDNWYEMREAIINHPEDEVKLVVQREDNIFEVNIPLETNLLDDSGQKMIGITQDMPVQYYETFGVFKSIEYGVLSSVSFIYLNYQALFKILTRPFLAREHIGGPVMIIAMSRQTSQMGWGAIIAFVASISLILMIMNLLPIPILDGGHIFFCILEGIFRKPLAYKTQLIIQQIGFMFIILLMLLAFYNDLSRIARRTISLRTFEMNETE